MHTSFRIRFETNIQQAENARACLTNPAGYFGSDLPSRTRAITGYLFDIPGEIMENFPLRF
ncbi:Uncharacterized protein dnm_068640 [Desulfonema magnum]|uniref:Uncharacterized protein n=1 Tax=Desulfonema magnum TaxID=45655 RepID=A0A975BSI0_9BACT|nr:Uncharacterized protein dnm_068640 [Desulfonema magnum]